MTIHLTPYVNVLLIVLVLLFMWIFVAGLILEAFMMGHRVWAPILSVMLIGGTALLIGLATGFIQFIP